jgi:hypothetical protein
LLRVISPLISMLARQERARSCAKQLHRVPHPAAPVAVDAAPTPGVRLNALGQLALPAVVGELVKVLWIVL